MIDEKYFQIKLEAHPLDMYIHETIELTYLVTCLGASTYTNQVLVPNRSLQINMCPCGSSQVLKGPNGTIRVLKDPYRSFQIHTGPYRSIWVLTDT